MLFEKTIAKLSGVPSYDFFTLNDVNPVSGAEKRRRLCKPNEPMRELHTKLIEYLRALPVDMRFSRAGRKGDRPILNILFHFQCSHFYLLDIKNAYETVDGRKLAAMLFALDGRWESEETAFQFLSRYCLGPHGGLLTGLPASMDLYNLYAATLLDGPLHRLAGQYQLVYTRYLDDITFSAAVPIGKKKRKAIRRIIEENGFGINHRKSRVQSLEKGAVTINGITIRQDHVPILPRHYLRKLRGLIHAAKKRKVNPAVVHGKMGVLKAIRRSPVSRREEKLLGEYRRFKERRMPPWR